MQNIEIDYKDAARSSEDTLRSQALAALRTRGLSYGKRRAIGRALQAMPCAYETPKAFSAWDSRPLQAAIAAAVA